MPSSVCTSTIERSAYGWWTPMELSSGGSLRASGVTVYSGQGSTNQGGNSFSWNGQDNNGNQLADGAYTLSVAAADGSGTPITSTVTSTGQVSEINMANGTPQLMVGGMPISLSGIASVTN